MLTYKDVEAIREAAPHYGKMGRDIIHDLHLLQIHERVQDVRYRPPDPERNWNRHYLEIDTDDVYFYDYSGTKRSKLGPFTIHLPLDEMSANYIGMAEAPIPSITGEEDEFGNTGPTGVHKHVYAPPHYKGHGTDWGGGLVLKGRFKGFKDHTGEGAGHESYHPHVYGGGIMLCLGGFATNMSKYGDYDLPAFIELAFKFLREGGRHGDDGDRHVSMYSNCFKEIFGRNSEKVEVKKVDALRKSKDALKSGLGGKKKPVKAAAGKEKFGLTKDAKSEKALEDKLEKLNAGASSPQEVGDLLDGILELLD